MRATDEEWAIIKKFAQIAKSDINKARKFLQEMEESNHENQV